MPGTDGHLRIALFVVSLLATSGISRADSPQWTDEFRVRFPDALLIEPPKRQVDSAIGFARVTSSDVEFAAVDSAGPSHGEPASFNEPLFDAPSPIVPHRRRHHCSDCPSWQRLPDGILYPSYIAGEKEPRMGISVLGGNDVGTVLEETIGGRLGLLRYGSAGSVNPQGWQWDLEAAAMLRQNIDNDLDVDAVDFRVGSVITYKQGATAYKAGYYHLSSHVGDEFLVRNPGFQRINYVRDSLIIGVYHNMTEAIAVYGEVAYAVKTDGGAEPFELQFGTEYSSPDAASPEGAPFAAVNFHLREEFDFGGGVNVLAGWEWIGPRTGNRFRIGGQLYSGKEIQWSFFDEDITVAGGGIWYDF